MAYESKRYCNRRYGGQLSQGKRHQRVLDHYLRGAVGCVRGKCISNGNTVSILESSISLSLWSLGSEGCRTMATHPLCHSLKRMTGPTTDSLTRFHSRDSIFLSTTAARSVPSLAPCQQPTGHSLMISGGLIINFSIFRPGRRSRWTLSSEFYCLQAKGHWKMQDS